MFLNVFQSVLRWMHPIWLQPGRGSPGPNRLEAVMRSWQARYCGGVACTFQGLVHLEGCAVRSVYSATARRSRTVAATVLRYALAGPNRLWAFMRSTVVACRGYVYLDVPCGMPDEDWWASSCRIVPGWGASGRFAGGMHGLWAV